MSVDPFEAGRLERRILATARRIYGLVPAELVDEARRDTDGWQAIAIVELGIILIAIIVGMVL